MANRPTNYTYTPSYTGNGRGYTGGNSRQKQPQRNAAPRERSGPVQRGTGTGAPRPAQVRYVETREPAPGRPMKDLLMFALVLFVVPLIGIIGIFYTPFLWVFAVASALCLAGIWLMRCFAQGTRMLLTVILLLFAVLSLIAAMNLTPKEETYPMISGANSLTQGYNSETLGQTNLSDDGIGTDSYANVQPMVTAPINMGFSVAQQTTQVEDTPVLGENVVNNAGSGFGDMNNGQQTNTQMVVGLPGSEAASPPENPVLNSAQAALTNYLTEWANRDFEAMVHYTLPSWRSLQNVPHQQLYWNHNWWILNNWTLSNEAVSPSADSATFIVTTDLSKSNSSQTPAKMIYTATVFDVDGTWYVDPDSMRNGIAPTETAQPEMGQVEVTAAPDPTVDPTMKLWYNSKGGQYYHAQQKCSKVGTQYHDAMESFTYSLLNESPYSKLNACSACEAPSKK